MPKLYRYQTRDGKQPINDWLFGLKDKAVLAQIRVRLRRIESGNLGDFKSVGDGVLELRIHISPGYRVYLGKHGDEFILLLCGGDKATQQADIYRARGMWADWKERRYEELQSIGIAPRSRA
jgi:hypothetical protein